jgi:hypothetical protein
MFQAIDNHVDQASGAVGLKEIFQNSEIHLSPGSIVHIHLWLAPRRDAAAISSAAAESRRSSPSSML